MKKHRASTRSASDRIANMAGTVAEATSERLRLNGELLQQLALALAANEKTQRRFRDAVLVRLAKIETMVDLIYAAQITEAVGWDPDRAEKLRRHTEHADKHVAEKSGELGLAMVNYIYGESESAGAQKKSRQKRSV